MTVTIVQPCPSVVNKNIDRGHLSSFALSKSSSMTIYVAQSFPPPNLPSLYTLTAFWPSKLIRINKWHRLFSAAIGLTWYWCSQAVQHCNRVNLALVQLDS